MTVKEAAASLNRSVRLVRAALATGVMKGTKAGRDWDVPAREVERYRRDHLRVKS